MTLGPERGAAMEKYLQGRGIAVPLLFVRNYVGLPVESLAELSEEQARDVTNQALAYKRQSRREEASKHGKNHS